MNPTQRHDRRLIVHIREANPEPPGLGAMERRAGRHVELNVLDDQPPQLHLRLKRGLVE